jgi:hypothetical protein
MRFEIVTAGRGMMEAGKVIGEIETETHDDAVEALREFLGGRPMIWDLRQSQKDMRE